MKWRESMSQVPSREVPATAFERILGLFSQTCDGGKDLHPHRHPVRSRDETDSDRRPGTARHGTDSTM
jgi:hypothetical protein